MLGSLAGTMLLGVVKLDLAGRRGCIKYRTLALLGEIKTAQPRRCGDPVPKEANPPVSALEIPAAATSNAMCLADGRFYRSAGYKMRSGVGYCFTTIF